MDGTETRYTLVTRDILTLLVCRSLADHDAIELIAEATLALRQLLGCS